MVGIERAWKQVYMVDCSCGRLISPSEVEQSLSFVRVIFTKILVSIFIVSAAGNDAKSK